MKRFVKRIPMEETPRTRKRYVIRRLLDSSGKSVEVNPYKTYKLDVAKRRLKRLQKRYKEELFIERL